MTAIYQPMKGLAFLLFAASVPAAEPEFSEVFTSGKDGIVSIRIPP